MNITARIAVSIIIVSFCGCGQRMAKIKIPDHDVFLAYNYGIPISNLTINGIDTKAGNLELKPGINEIEFHVGHKKFNFKQEFVIDEMYEVFFIQQGYGSAAIFDGGIRKIKISQQDDLP